MTYGNSPASVPAPIRHGARILLLLVLTFSGSGTGQAAEIEEVDPLVLQTVRDLRSVVLCVEAYHLDNDAVPGPTEGFVTTEFLLPYVEPFYIRVLPVDDGWGTPYRYWSNGSEFTVISYGADGLADRNYAGAVEYEDGGDDLVVVNGIPAAVPLQLRQLVRGGQQKATMSDLRSIATAVEAFKIDNDRCPGPTPGQVEVSWILEQLQPVYIRMLPQEDAWGTPFVYWSDGEHYRIASLGQDREQDGPFEEIEPGTATQTFSSDIVFEDGEFTQFPEGEQY